MIYSNDHDPAHVHVFCDGREIIFHLGEAGVTIRDITPGMRRSDVREAFRIAEDQHLHLLMAWREINAQRS
nr:DUF4160 domain-containing protein [Komagataeibacter europaeus]